MVITSKQHRIDEIENMRGGEGTITIAHVQKKDEMENCRLFALITIPVGASIGEHEHHSETEYYIIQCGEGEVVDNGTPVKVAAGDVVVTGDGSSHSIRNTGSEPLEMMAVIVTY